MRPKSEILISPEELFEPMLSLLQEGYDAEFTVTGNSMWPFLCHKRDKVTIRREKTALLRKGDIVLLRTEYGYLLHRISRRKGDMLQTTGDCNCYRDAYIETSCVLGKVVTFTRKGKVISCQDPLYRFLSWLWSAMYPVRPLLLGLLLRQKRRTK